MINFGLSAYMKIIGLNEKPRKTAVRYRLFPKEGGYDFHKSTRNAIKHLVVGSKTFEQVTSDITKIVKSAERNSAQNGIKNFMNWLSDNPHEVTSLPSAKITSKSDAFTVTYTADVALVLNGRTVGIHIWNTQAPKLTEREAQAALALFANEYDETIDIAVLCLRTQTLHVLIREEKIETLGSLVARDIDLKIQSIIDELDHDSPPPPDQPSVH